MIEVYVKKLGDNPFILCPAHTPEIPCLSPPLISLHIITTMLYISLMHLFIVCIFPLEYKLLEERDFCHLVYCCHIIA